MAEGWIGEYWFNAVQTIGIVGGLVFSGVGLRREIRSRRVEHELVLAAQHRALWGELHRRPDLSRIGQWSVDLIAQPITPAEEEFLRLVLTHYLTGWTLAKENSLQRVDLLRRDAADFFRLPIPFAVWRQARVGFDPEFVRFVDEAIGRTK